MLSGSFGDLLAENIVKILSGNVGLTVPQILTKIEQPTDNPIPLATLYRRVNQLYEGQILVRHKRKYSLNLIWVDELIRQAQAVKSVYSPLSNVLVNLPSREGQFHDYRASSLIQLDPLWNSLLFQIGTKFDERQFIGYNSHGWHALAMIQTERRLFESLIAHRVKVKFIIGGDYKLDHLAASQLKIPGLEVLVGADKADTSNAHCFWVGKNYTIECRFPDSVARQFADILESDCDFDEDIHKKLNKIFREKDDFKLRVKKSAKYAEELRTLAETWN